jgi:hypothetical protein
MPTGFADSRPLTQALTFPLDFHMPHHDTESTTLVSLIFIAAWRKCIDDYIERRINSEHCLQASLYRHLTNALPKQYSVYTEAVIKLSEATKAAEAKNVAVVDLLICEERTVIAAVEIKFTPRKTPKVSAVKKDLTSLASISNRRNLHERCAIEMPRFHSRDAPTLTLDILSQRKLIFAAFCTEESAAMKPELFWNMHRPETGYWEGRSIYPKNICIAMAYTSDGGIANPHFFGPGFERIIHTKD